MIKIDKKTIAHLERRQAAYLWGQKHFIKPVFITEALGNGKLLLGLTPLNTRPNFYLIRIDSKWLQKENTDAIYDHLDEIYDAIEDQVGPREWTDDGGKEHAEGWPCLNLDCGTSWWNATDLLVIKK